MEQLNQCQNNSQGSYAYTQFEESMDMLANGTSYLIKIPKDIIMDKSLGNKRVIVYLYLHEHMTIRGFVYWTINELVTWCGYKPESKKGGMNHQFIDCLQKFADLGYITSHPDFESLKSEPKNGNTFQCMELDVDNMECPQEFGQIMSDEVSLILNFREIMTSAHNEPKPTVGKIFPSHLSLVLSYIMLNMSQDSSKLSCCRKYYYEMAEDIGISKRYISQCTDILQNIGILKHTISKLKKDTDGRFYTAPKIFVHTGCFDGVKFSSSHNTINETNENR